MKKVLSLVLVIAMVLSSMSFAFAATTPALSDIADSDYEKAIETLTALGIINGYEDGTYKPEKTITRAEVAKILVEALGYGDLVAGASNVFPDTANHWAKGYIAVASGTGLVIGYPDGTFRPDTVVTYDEVLTMVIRALGYTDAVLSGTWPTNYKVKAIDLDLTDDVTMAKAEADRGGVAQIFYNTLDAKMVEIDEDGIAVPVDPEKLFIDNVAEPKDNYEVTEASIDPDNDDYASEIVDLTPYVYQHIDAYFNDDDQVVYVKDSNSLVYEGTIDDVVTEDKGTNDAVTTVSIEDANGKIKEVDFSDNVGVDDTDEIAYDVFENGVEKEDAITYEDLLDSETIKIVAGDDKDLGGDGDGKIDQDEVRGIVTTLRTDLVRVEKEYVEGKDSLEGIQLPTDDDEVDLDKITIKGDAESLADIKVDDVVAAYAAEDDEVITLVVTRKTVEGKVTTVTDKNTVSIDGTSYDLASLSIVGDWALELGDEGTFYLDQDGDIADYDGSSVGPTDYAVVLGSADGEISEKYGYSIEEYPTLKLATQENEQVVYEVAVEIDEDDASITDSAELDDDALFTTADDINAAKDAIDIDTNVTGEDDAFVDGVYELIKYSLDEDGRIDEIESVGDVSAYTIETGTGAPTTDKIDLDSDDVVDGVVVFDATDGDFEIVSLDSLDTEFIAYSVLDDNGDIEVLVVKSGEVDEAASTIYAYLNKVTLTYNDAGKKVNEYTIYVDGEKKVIKSDDDAKDVKTYNKAVSFDYNDDVIDDSDVTIGVTGVSVTATSINAKGGKIQLDVPDGTTFGGVTLTDKWYTLSDHATIVEVDPTTSTPNGVDKIDDLYDIDEGDVLEVFFNADGDIDLIVITQD